MKHLRHLLALALAAALTLMLLLPTYAAVIDGVYTDYMTGLKFTIPADLGGVCRSLHHAQLHKGDLCLSEGRCLFHDGLWQR